MIYMIECMDYIKIGFTTDIQKRLSQLQVSSPLKLKLIALFEGDVAMEKQLHDKFNTYWSNGEWFHKNQELVDFAESQSQELLWKCGYIPNEKQSPIGLIKSTRIKKGLTLEDLANKLGITKQSVQDMELREMQGRITINKLAETLGTIGYKFESRCIEIN